jgi:hypothetical protein
VSSSKDTQQQIETMLCFLAARWISEDRDADNFVVVDKPDVSNRNDPAADLLCRDSVGLLLVEHTELQHFEQAVSTSVDLRRMFDGQGVRVARPEGAQWQLRVPEGWIRQHRKRARAAGEEVASWVRSQLTDDLVAGAAVGQSARFAGEGSPVIWRWTTHPIRPEADGGGLVRVAVQVGNQTTVDERLDRVASKVLSDKMVKFDYPAAQGATSVLVLEDQDWSLGPVPIPTSRAMAAAAKNLNVGLPDHIVLIGTAFGNLLGWHIWDSVSWHHDRWDAFRQWPDEVHHFSQLHAHRIASDRRR